MDRTAISWFISIWERPVPHELPIERAMLSAYAEPPGQPAPVAAKTVCRLCGAPLHRTLIDLGSLPVANRTVAADAGDEAPYRLHIRICDNCTLVQREEIAALSPIAATSLSVSSRFNWGSRQAGRVAEIVGKRFRLDSDALVIEVGPSDGCLLRRLQTTAIPFIGFEPLAAQETTPPGMRTETARFNTDTAMQIAVRHGCADLLVASNVLQHAPDPFDFVAGLGSVLRPTGIVCVQVPHLLSLLQHGLFDGFRHDVYAYLSLRVLEHLFRSVGLRVFDAERLPDHGGSLRIYACHAEASHGARPGLKSVRGAERVAELDQRDLYAGFSARIAVAQGEIRQFLRNKMAAGHRVAAYGASTRGATMLNCCDITAAEIECVADPEPLKHGRLMPGSRIPVVSRQALLSRPPDDVVILNWPDIAEIAGLLQPLRQRGTKLWTALPKIARV